MITASTGVAMHRPEEEWAARCRAGDLEAFSQVYACYEQAVFRYAYRLLGDRDDAADVRQETFLRAYQAIGTLRRGASLQTWLLRICTNLCRDHWKGNRRRAAAHDEAAGELDRRVGDSDPAVQLERSQTRETLARALHSLPAGQRELIVLREYEELSAKEIGAILGCAEATVRVRLFHARRRLRERVESLMGER